MIIGESSRLLAIIVLFVLIFLSAITVLDTHAKKIIGKPPVPGPKKSLTKPLADRTKATEVQIKEIKIPKLPYNPQYRGDLVIEVNRKTHELYTDLFNSLMPNMVVILRNLIFLNTNNE